MEQKQRLRAMWTVAARVLPSVGKESTASRLLIAVTALLAKIICVCRPVGSSFLCESRCGFFSTRNRSLGYGDLHRDSSSGSCGLFQDSETICLGVPENEFSVCIKVLFVLFTSLSPFCFCFALFALQQTPRSSAFINKKPNSAPKRHTSPLALLP